MIYIKLFNKVTNDINTESLKYVHDMMIKNFNFDDSNEEIILNKYGKPYYKNKNLYFNIAHSNNIILIGVSNEEIGVDIELIKDIRKVLLRKMFTSEELISFNKLKGINQLDVFYERWTKIECFTKLKGISISMGLHNKDFSMIKSFKYQIKKEDYYISVSTLNGFIFQGEN